MKSVIYIDIVRHTVANRQMLPVADQKSCVLARSDTLAFFNNPCIKIIKKKKTIKKKNNT